MFRAIYSDSITLYLINEENLAATRSMFEGFPESDYILKGFDKSYVPRFENGKLTKYGFYAMLENKLAGLSLLGINSRKTLTGYTGADTLLHMRGKGVAPRSKPHLFYLAFEILGLHRVETGCFISNLASKKSIEKTIGFHFEGTTRQSGLNDDGEFEDEYRYAILRQDWIKHYDKTQIEIIY